ncbi:MAG: hypothetical protein HYU32_06300, partial [candidate division NC10 bacterium]|nr:hypothetical protein [candidate division NC10 bacterium]
CFWIGLYPAPFLKAMEASVANVIQIVEKGAAGKAVGAKQAAATGQVGNPVIAKVPDRQVANLGSRLAALDSKGSR